MSARLEHRHILLVVAAVPWLLMACGSEPAPAAATSRHPIQGGTNDTKHQFAVGILATTSRGTALCSGALIAPNLVATARHCVAAVPASGVITCPTTMFGALTPAKSIVVSTEPDLRAITTGIAVSKIIVPAGADQTSVCGNDIALLILSQNISLPDYVTPVIDPPMSDHTRYSPTVTAIGYGLTSASDTAGTSAGIRRIRQGIALTCIPEDSTFPNCYPSRSFPMTAAEFLSGNGTCEGDSGSDAYEEDNFDAGRWFGFGVLSRGGESGSTCLGGIYTRFDAWASLLIDAANQAATAGGYDLPPWAQPAGSGGDAATDARDGSTGDGATAADANGDGSPPKDGGGATDATADGARDAGISPDADGGTATDGGTSSDGSSTSADAPATDARADATTSDARTLPDSLFPTDSNVPGFEVVPEDARAGGGEDATGNPSEAGAATDAGPKSDGNPAAPSETVVGSSFAGCSCATAGSAGGAQPAWGILIAGVGLGLALRRRRRAARARA